MIPHFMAYIFLVFNMALWGGALVVARGVHEIAPPMALTFWRWVVTALILFPFVVRDLSKELPLKKEARYSVYWVCITMSIGTTLSLVSVNYTSAINAAVINGTQPAVTALAAFIVLRERLTKLQLIGIMSAFLGIVVIGFQANITRLLQMAANFGDFVMLGAVACWSLYAVEVHRAKCLPSYGVLLFLTACAGAIFGLPLYLIEETFSRSIQLNSTTVLSVLYLGLGSTVIAVSLWNISIRSVGVNRAAIFLNLIPVFGACFAIVFLNEKMFFYHVIGSAMIILGIIFAVKKVGEQSIS